MWLKYYKDRLKMKKLLLAIILVMVYIADAAETPQWPKKPPENWMTYHLAHPGPGHAWPADPNPAFYYKGRYHLHYIYHHPTSYHNLTNFVYGHVSSKDMVHWKWHPTVLGLRGLEHGMFSGTGFFTKQGTPAIIYVGVRPPGESAREWLTYAMDDNLDKWSKPEIVELEPQVGQKPEILWGDPDCWLRNGTYYATTGGIDPHLMKSSDLKNWKYLGRLLHDDYPADLGVTRKEDISCANMFRIGNKWMLLCISHKMGCRYYLGDFKDEKYLPEFHARMNWKNWNFFAPESLLTPDGRRVMWAWMENEDKPKGVRELAEPRGIQSLPRELELPSDGILRIKPLRELETLRYDQKSEKNITIKSDEAYILKQIAGDTVELKVEFKSSKAKEFGVNVLCGQKGEHGMVITVIPASKTLRLGTVNAPFELKQGEDLTLRIFIDKNMVEVFANDRQAMATAHKKRQPLANIQLFTKGADLQIKKVTAWKMKTIYQGNTVFNGNSKQNHEIQVQEKERID